MKPNYKLKAMNKVNGDRCNDVGAAWINPNGSISIVLNPCIKLEYNKDLILTLFPNGNESMEEPPPFPE